MTGSAQGPGGSFRCLSLCMRDQRKVRKRRRMAIAEAVILAFCGVRESVDGHTFAHKEVFDKPKLSHMGGTTVEKSRETILR